MNCNQKKQLQIFCDIPRGSGSEDSVKQYFDAGFTCWVMTEDDAPLTDSSGVITEEYKRNIEHVSQYGEVYLRNHYNYCNCWNNPEETKIVRWGEVVTIPKRNITNEFNEIGNITGYCHIDEPTYDVVGEMFPLVQWHNDYAKDKVFHANLFPSYGEHLFSGHTLEEYVRHYVDIVLTKVRTSKTLGLDNYPLIKENGKNCLRESYLSDLLTIARIAKEYNGKKDRSSDITVGYCIQAFRDVALRDIECREDISFQVNTCLAMGARYLEYYLYCAIDEQVGLLDTDNMKREVYDYVKSMNEEVKRWEDTLLSFSWHGMKTFAGTFAHDNKIAFEMVKKYESENFRMIESVKCNADTIISEFVGEDNQYAYMIVNYTEPTEYVTDHIVVSFEKSVKEISIYHKGKQKQSSIINGVFAIELPAGDAVFVIPYGEE